MHREEEILYFGVSAAFAVGITLLLWLLVQIWNKFRALKYSISDIPLPGFNPFDGPTVTCTCENSCQKHVTQLESAVVGCNFISVPRSKIPKVQVALYSMTNNSRLEKYLGAAVRIGDYLVAPHHVLAASEKFGALSNSEPATAFWLDAANFESLDGDLVATSLSESSFALLGLAKANLATVDGPSMAAITSASRTPEISFGVLNHDPKIFGGMIFGGSTKGGFSGAAYMIGKQIAGIHLGGGVVNYGVNATYIQALLRKPETAEWLNMLRKKNGPLKYSRSKFNPDEAQVFAYGRYHTIDLALLEGDIEEPAGDTYMPAREVEVNMSESFPPQYVDVAAPLVEAVNSGKIEMELRLAAMSTEESLKGRTLPKNLDAAEVVSAETSDYLKNHLAILRKIEERTMVLQSVQDSVSNRYREIQNMLAEVPKSAERTVLVEENERLKKELTEIKKLKTSVNADVSLMKVIPKAVRQAQARAARGDLLMKLKAEGNDLEQVMQALVDKGLVYRVAGPVGNVATTVAKSPAENVNQSQPSLISQNSSD